MDAPDRVRPALKIKPEHEKLLTVIASLPSGYRLPCWMDPDRWFATDGPSKLSATRDCSLCPVRDECLAAATAADEKWGVWGGVVFPLQGDASHCL
ncbi:WhiB family transcriptional regulator [Streptomyces albogriseolus]|uniref:WhiB family transcriptional regulator n=1 Tax=Streptomyces albogriseolus TaxID=1887 RepID=UPI003460A5F5